MKKTYINPNMKVVRIQATMQMLAGSTGPDVTNTKYNPEEEGEFIAGREFDFVEE